MPTISEKVNMKEKVLPLNREAEEHWVPDPRAESVLRELGVAFETRDISIKDINWKESEKNAGRPGFGGKPFSQDNVDDFASSMKKSPPDKFFMPVYADTDNGIVIAAGLHRSKAALKAGLHAVRAYFYKPKLEYELRLVAFMTNRREGVRLDQHEAMEYAIHLVTAHGMKREEVAFLANVNKATLDSRLRTHAMRKQLAEVGYTPRLADSTLRSMAKLAHNTKVLVEACRVIESNGLPTSDDEVRKFIAPVLAVKTEAQQLAVLERLAAEAQRQESPSTVDNTNGRVTTVSLTIRKEFLRSLRSLMNAVGERTTMEDIQISPDSEDAEAVRRDWVALRRKMNAICNK